ncbi:glycosyl transferase family 2 protein [Nitzschia inconspicua]|uniref:Glycosyl transferase family 2 protein n=1 Tax=Nitzschia inconspicua TaxID=303405 RepID=A0A9K3KK38_9STRA|nr:glycosyl transferase family 2 protein [Nitzschia inconspicua]
MKTHNFKLLLYFVSVWPFPLRSEGWQQQQPTNPIILFSQLLGRNPLNALMRRCAAHVTDSIESPPPSPTQLIILIPAFNEAERIPSTIACYRRELQTPTLAMLLVGPPKILVIDDGSSDYTYEVVTKTFSNDGTIQCIRLPYNQGKGAALAAGIDHISKVIQLQEQPHSDIDTLILTQDADGSGDLRYLPQMILILWKLLRQYDTESSSCIDSKVQPTNSFPAAMVVGNRNFNFFTPRGVTRWGFQTVVKLLMNDLRVQDSQCGYKLLTLSAARSLYKDLHLRGWSHDVEVLHRAKLLSIPIAEVPIDWEDKEGSKVVASGVAKVSLQMLWDVIRLRWNYSFTQAWQLSAPSAEEMDFF